MSAMGRSFSDVLKRIRRALCGAHGGAVKLAMASVAAPKRAKCRPGGFPIDFQQVNQGLKRGRAMKFLCLVYVEPDVFRALPAAERAVIDRDSGAYDQALEARGRYILAAALQPVGTAKTVRRRGGKVLLTDGPFAETKEVLAGFIFIEAKDLDEALRIATDIPMARVGSVEVRPEMTFGD
jgi:hypothetical protein